MPPLQFVARLESTKEKYFWQQVQKGHADGWPLAAAAYLEALAERPKLDFEEKENLFMMG